MSTRAQIAIQTGPDKWAHVYVHFDGYPSHMLDVLAHWTPADILAAKEVTNTSVPLQLRQDPTQKKRRQPDTDDDPAKTGATGSGDNPTKKKPRLVNSNQKLIQAFKPIFADNPTASIKAMCELSTCKVNQLFPNDKRRCVLGALKGECTYATCRNTHNYTVTDNEAEHILTLLQPIIDDPGKLSRVSR